MCVGLGYFYYFWLDSIPKIKLIFVIHSFHLTFQKYLDTCNEIWQLLKRVRICRKMHFNQEYVLTFKIFIIQFCYFILHIMINDILLTISYLLYMVRKIHLWIICKVRLNILIIKFKLSMELIKILTTKYFYNRYMYFFVFYVFIARNNNEM